MAQSIANKALAAGKNATANQRQTVFDVGKAIVDEAAPDVIGDREIKFDPGFAAVKSKSKNGSDVATGSPQFFNTRADARAASR